MGYIGTKPANAALTSADIEDGIITAPKIATDAVETVIVDHYRKQLEEINKFDEKEIKKKLEKFLEEESEHQKAGNDNIDSEDLKIKIFKIFVKKGTDIAIKISQKI